MRQFLIVFAIFLKTVCVAQPKIDTLCLPTEKVRELVTYKQQYKALDKKVFELNNTIFLLNANAVDYIAQISGYKIKDSICTTVQVGYAKQVAYQNRDIAELNKDLRREKGKKRTVSFLSLLAIGALTYLYITK